MKKMLCTMLCLLVTLGMLTGCTGGTTSSLNSSSSLAESQPKETLFKIGLIQYVEHPSLDTIREAFINRLEEWGYDETKVQIDYQNAAGDPSNVNTICQKFVGDKVDMIVAIATPAAQTAVSAAQDTDITVLFSAVNDPQKDLGIKDPAKPSGNVTGTSDRIPVNSTIDLAMQNNPNLKTFGLLYNSGESNSVAAAEQAKAYCKEKGIEVVEGTVSNTSEIQQVTTDLCTKVDAIFTSTDNSIASSIGVVTEATRSAKVPWYVGADSMVQDGALAAIGIDYKELGAKTADMAVELMEGKPVEQVPVYFFETYQTYINQTTLKAMEKITFTDEVMQSAVVFE